MPKVPKIKPYKASEQKYSGIYCFPKGTSEADKQHDIEQINLWIDHIKKRKKAQQQNMEE